MISHVIKEHTSSYTNPIEFSVDDLLEIGTEDQEYPGWIWVKVPDGNEGWAPKEYIELLDHSKQGVAKSNYCARELDVKIGERLQIKNTLCGWYYAINAQGVNGWVPQECVQPE